MIISSINRFCAKHGRLTYLFIGGAIIIPFVFLYGDFRPGSSGDARDPVMGSMHGKTFTRAEFFNYLGGVKVKFYLDYQRYMGSNDQIFRNPEILKVVSDQVLNQMRALNEARNLGIDNVTDDEVREKIMNHAAFTTDEKFDKEKFKEFEDTFLRAEGLSKGEFDDIIKENIIVGRIERRVTEGVSVSDSEMRSAHLGYFTKCEAEVSNFYSFKYLSEVEVTDEEIEIYFNQHLEDKYRIGEQVQLQIAEFSNDDYTDKLIVSEKDMQQNYDENRANLYAKEQIKLRHIQISTTATDTDEASKIKREKIDEIKNTLNRDNFAEIAKETSEDKASARKGGDLGFVDLSTIGARYGQEFLTSVKSMKVNEINDVLESTKGFHIVQKLEDRDGIPFSEAKVAIERKLIRELEEEEAREYFNENEEEFAIEEINARHILLKLNPDDTDEIKEEKRQKLEGILAEAKEKDNFPDLAKIHSEDASNANKGGDLGFFGKGKMVKPFEDVAFALGQNEISDIVETNFGFHIIQKLDERNNQSFDTVKSKIIGDLKSKKRDDAKKSAQEQATLFAIELHKALQESPNDKKADAFVQFCSQYSENKNPIVVPVESGFFTEKDNSIPGISGFSKTLATEGSKLSIANPLSEVIESGPAFYVVCWQASRESYLPSFREDASDNEEESELKLSSAAKLAERDLRNDKSIERAREEARISYEAIKQKLDEGVVFSEASGDMAFSPTGEFSLSQGPNNANKETIKTVAQETKAGHLAAPKDVDNGSVLVYISKHTLPSDEDFEEIKSFLLPQYKRQQQQAILNQYYKQLESSSDTMFTDDWQFILDTPEVTESGQKEGS